MNEMEFKELREASWRRRLTAGEEDALHAYLAGRVEKRMQWEDELSLTELLGKLPEASVSTNFTTRVLQAVERDVASERRRDRGIFDRLKLNWLPRIAVASVFICAAVFSVIQYRANQRAEIAHDIAAVSQAATVPQEWLQDFEAINRLSQPRVDDVLLAALQ